MKNILFAFLRDYKGTLIWMTLLGLISTVCQVVSLFGIVNYVNFQMTNEVPENLQVISQLFMFSQTYWHLPASVMVLLALLLSVYTRYKTRRISVDTMVLHEKNALKKLLLNLGPEQKHIVKDKVKFKELVRLSSADIRKYARLVASLMDCLLPCMYILVGFMVLFFLHWKLTVGLVIGLIPFILITGKRSRKISRIGVELETNARSDTLERRELLKQQLTSGKEHVEQGAINKAVDTNTEINQFLATYRDRINVNHLSVLYAGLFLAGFVALALFIVSIGMQQGDEILASAVIYLLVLNFSLTQLKALVGLVTKIRVFQPFALRYIKACDSF